MGDTLGDIAKRFEDMLETLQKTKRDRLVLDHNEEEPDVAELKRDEEPLDHNEVEEIDHREVEYDHSAEEHNAELLKQDRVKTFNARRRRCQGIKTRNQTVERRERLIPSKRRRRHDITGEDATTASEDSCDIEPNDSNFQTNVQDAYLLLHLNNTNRGS
jgi:ribonuclease BN (tRNA processing enzyme)